jgi:predicted dehydrogenase
MSTPLQRVAVIGMGYIGNLHARLYTETSGARLVAVCDIDRERADAAAARFRVPAFYSVEELLRNADFDMVSVTTGGEEYGSDHYLPTMQALEAGKHVLGEKPISNDIGQAREMVALAKQKNLCYGINMNHRFTPAARLAKRWVNENKLGHLLFVNVSMWIHNPRESSPWFQIKALHPHTINLIHYFAGPIKKVHCFATKAPGRKIWSTAQFNLMLENGAVGHLCGSYDIARGHPMERVEVAGLNGRFVIEDMYQQATLYPAGNLEKTVYTNPVFGGMQSFDDTFRNRIQTFVTQINEGTPPDEIDGSGREGLAAQLVLDAAIRSIQEHSEIEVDPIDL